MNAAGVRVVNVGDVREVHEACSVAPFMLMVDPLPARWRSPPWADMTANTTNIVDKLPRSTPGPIDDRKHGGPALSLYRILIHTAKILVSKLYDLILTVLRLIHCVIPQTKVGKFTQ